VSTDSYTAVFMDSTEVLVAVHGRHKTGPLSRESSEYVSPTPIGTVSVGTNVVGSSLVGPE